MRLTPFLLVPCLVAACAIGPSYDEQIWQDYRVGMTRDEVHAMLAEADLLVTATRPPSGWSDTVEDDHGAARAARTFERAHPEATVETCEVFWVDRHTSLPLAVGGVWFDYLFSDGEDRLLGYERRFVD